MLSGEGASYFLIVYRIIFSGFAIIIGLSGFIVWLTVLGLNQQAYATVAYAGFSGVIAIWNFVLHLMHFQDLWRTWLKGLRIFIAAGILFAAISIVSFIAFIAVAAVRKEKMDEKSFYVAAIWSGWSAILSFFLHRHSKKYRNEFADLTALLEF
ncbi:heme transporter hrg1-A-like [Clavelina lepadiformis]|uniref:Heme transporter hrg1-A n=1 Tax=Clavelina lepadiformis TaxID=159417 RepID=A0ABP0FVL9_CLALP